MAKYLLIISVVICAFSVFLVLDVDQLSPYQKLIKSYIPGYVKNIVDTGITFIKSQSGLLNERVYTKSQLSSFIGENNGDIYLALLGSVFDVTKGRKHYGPDGGYSGFSGRDGTRAFVSGEFTDKGLIEDVSGLSLEDVKGLEGWKDFYKRTYTYIGKLEGHFYDINGQPTVHMTAYQSQLKLVREQQHRKDDEAQRFPPCNSESKQDGQIRLWCTNLSGGISRDWVGLPREFHQVGRRHMRCACVRTTGPPSNARDDNKHENRGDLDDPRFSVYPGCKPNSESCLVDRVKRS